MKNDIMIINKETIKDKIFTIRGQKVMLDFHLAEIYGYTTKAFNQQVKNNIEKFDSDFRFQLTNYELDFLRSNFLTSKISEENRGGRRYLPYAFTEQGIYMLMTVLKGEKAVEQSKTIIRLFKEMKDYIINNSYVSYEDFVRYSLNVSDNIKKIENKIDKDLVSKKEFYGVIDELTDIKTSKEYLIFDGKKIEGYLAYKEIYSLANESIYIIDNYIDLKTLVLLKDINKNIKIVIFSDNVNKSLHEFEYNDFVKEYNFDIHIKKTNGIFHDRYIVIDYNTNNEMIYHSGPSSKDIGRRIGTISKINDIRAYHNLIDEILDNNELILT